MSISCGPDLPAVEHTTSTRRHHKIIDDGRTLDRYPVEVLREWKAKREAEFDTATREALHGLGDLPTRLPDLLVEAFRDATAKLPATVDRPGGHRPAHPRHRTAAARSAGRRGQRRSGCR